MWNLKYLNFGYKTRINNFPCLDRHFPNSISRQKTINLFKVNTGSQHFDIRFSSNNCHLHMILSKRLQEDAITVWKDEKLVGKINTLADLAVQIGVVSADKSVHANQNINFHYHNRKSTIASGYMATQEESDNLDRGVFENNNKWSSKNKTGLLINYA